MKKLLTFILLAKITSNYAQITFEFNYHKGQFYTNHLRLVKLSSSGIKYATNDTDTLTLYNLNHTVYKKIPIPLTSPPICTGCGTYGVYYISEELFDTNPANVEFFFQYMDNNHIYHSRIYNESGTLLFSKDTTLISSNYSVYSNEDFISYTPLGTKMIISYQYGGQDADVYALPGTLTCHDCTNGTVTSIIKNNAVPKTEKTSSYPNPTAGQTTIEYILPQGVNTADLVFYNITGKEVKRFKVTQAFHDIIISTADFDAGIYYYQIQAGTDFNASKKMIVIK